MRVELRLPDMSDADQARKMSMFIGDFFGGFLEQDAELGLFTYTF